jgi:competence protein ComGC
MKMPERLKQMKTNKGTIVEFVVILLLVTITASVFIPAMIQYRKNSDNFTKVTKKDSDDSDDFFWLVTIIGFLHP